MKPKSFTYVRPTSVDEAVQSLAKWREDSHILAGGQSLVPMMNFRLVDAQVLINVSDLAPLAYIREIDGEIEVGASTTQGAVHGVAEVGRTSALVERGHAACRALPDEEPRHRVRQYRPFRSELRIAARVSPLSAAALS